MALVGGEEAALCSAVDAQGVLPGEHHGHGGAAGIAKHTAAPCRAREVACCSQHFGGVFGADGQVDLLLLCHIFWILFCGFETPCPGSRLCFPAGS